MTLDNFLSPDRKVVKTAATPLVFSEAQRLVSERDDLTRQKASREHMRDLNQHMVDTHLAAYLDATGSDYLSESVYDDAVRWQNLVHKDTRAIRCFEIEIALIDHKLAQKTIPSHA